MAMRWVAAVICVLAMAKMARAGDNDIPAWAYLPEASFATGMNSPLVQQAQDLLRRAALIELTAAQTPNDPRVKATAAAMAADLRGRAAIMMQVNSDYSRSQRDELERRREQRRAYCRLADGRFVQC